MLSIYLKEIRSFFSSITGYVVVCAFVLILGLFLFVFPDTSLLVYNYAGLDQFFSLAPMIFVFLIPAITMRSISEEVQTGTFEYLATKPISDTSIVLAKFLGSLTLVVIALLPSVIYFYSIYELASPRGNVDVGGILGSYVGLVLLAGLFTSIGVWASSMSKNQVTSFIFGSLICFGVYWAFLYMSKLPIFFGGIDDIVEKLGADYHYRSLSRGLLDSRDVIYFLSLIFFFLYLTYFKITKHR